MFGNHSLCQDLWCTKLQADKIDDPTEKLKKDNPKNTEIQPYPMPLRSYAKG